MLLIALILNHAAPLLAVVAVLLLFARGWRRVGLRMLIVGGVSALLLCGLWIGLGYFGRIYWHAMAALAAAAFSISSASLLLLELLRRLRSRSLHRL